MPEALAVGLGWLGSSIIGDFSPLELLSFLGAPLPLLLAAYLAGQIARDGAALAAEEGDDELLPLEKRLGAGAEEWKLNVMAYLGVLLLCFMLLAAWAGTNPASPDMEARARLAVVSIASIGFEFGAGWLVYKNWRIRRRSLALMREVVRIRRARAAGQDGTGEKGGGTWS